MSRRRSRGLVACSVASWCQAGVLREAEELGPGPGRQARVAGLPGARKPGS